MIDSRAGLLPDDRAFAQIVRKSGKKTIVVANKSEGKAGGAGALEAFALGLGEPITISAEHGEGLGELYDALRDISSGQEEDDEAEEKESDRDHPRRRDRPSQCRQIHAHQ